jgi:hypothetical protein
MPAKFEEDGQWYCGTHAPSKVQARKVARREAEQAEWKRESEVRDNMRERSVAIAALLTERFGVEVISTPRYYSGRFSGNDLIVQAHKIPRDWLVGL